MTFAVFTFHDLVMVDVEHGTKKLSPYYDHYLRSFQQMLLNLHIGHEIMLCQELEDELA